MNKHKPTTSPQATLPRRNFLQLGALTAAALSVSGVAARADAVVKPGFRRPSGGPKNIIFLISDGMSTGVLDLADSFSLMERNGQGTQWRQLLEDDDAETGVQCTHSLNSPVTDSAAAASSFGSGCRVCNGTINTFPDGRELTTLGQLVKSAGKSMGLVTTATVTHATPAGLVARVTKRAEEDRIADQYYETNVDVMMGGGSKFFMPDARKDGRDLAKAFQDKGYGICRKRQDLIALGRNDSRILGLFAEGYLPYTIDWNQDIILREAIPSLAEMSEATLRALSANPEGFVCLIEGARVDHAAHNNDAAALLWDQLAFDDALGVALRFAQEHPDTLVVTTSDHGNSNPGLNGYGPSYSESGERFKTLSQARQSYQLIQQWAVGLSRKGDVDAENALRAGIHERLGFELSRRECAVLLEIAKNGKLSNWNYLLNTFGGHLGQMAANHYGIGWTGTTHTSDYVVVSAKGPGQEHFHGLVQNYQIFDSFCDLMGIDFRNKPYDKAV